MEIVEAVKSLSSAAIVFSRSRIFVVRAVLIIVGAVNLCQAQPPFVVGADFLLSRTVLIIIRAANNSSTSSKKFYVANAVAASFFKIDPG